MMSGSDNGTAGAGIRAILIDLDGTLLDTLADLAAAANAVRTDLGLATLPTERIGQFVGKGADVLMQRLLTDDPHGTLPPAQLGQARARFDHHYARVNGRWATPYPGVVEGVDRLREAGMRLACVTNKPQVFADALLKAKNMASWFELVLGGDALAEKKPHPMPLLHVAAQFGFAPHECAIIGDSQNDALAARAAGMLSFLVPYGYNEGVDIAMIDCDYRVDSLVDAAQCLGA